MDAQEIFDTVAKHLATQGRRAFSEAKGACMYSMPDGRKCAVGCLLPEGTEAADFVGSVGPLNESGFLPEELKPHLDLLIALQSDHDTADCRDERALKVRLAETARVFDLSPAILNTLTFPGRWA